MKSFHKPESKSYKKPITIKLITSFASSNKYCLKNEVVFGKYCLINSKLYACYAKNLVNQAFVYVFIYAFFEWLVNKVSQQDFDDLKNGKLLFDGILMV